MAENMILNILFMKEMKKGSLDLNFSVKSNMLPLLPVTSLILKTDFCNSRTPQTTVWESVVYTKMQMSYFELTVQTNLLKFLSATTG